MVLRESQTVGARRHVERVFHQPGFPEECEQISTVPRLAIPCRGRHKLRQRRCVLVRNPLVAFTGMSARAMAERHNLNEG